MREKLCNNCVRKFTSLNRNSGRVIDTVEIIFECLFAASLMSSLAHTRAGITDAMYTVGAIEILIDCLNSDNEQVI